MSQGHGNTMARHFQMWHIWKIKLTGVYKHTCPFAQTQNPGVKLNSSLSETHQYVFQYIVRSWPPRIWPRFTRYSPTPVQSTHLSERSILSFLHSRSPIWSDPLKEKSAQSLPVMSQVCVSKHKCPSLDLGGSPVRAVVCLWAAPLDSLLSPLCFLTLTSPHSPKRAEHAPAQGSYAWTLPGPIFSKMLIIWVHSSAFLQASHQQMWPPPPHQHTISLFFLQSISHHLIWIYPVIYSNTSRVDAWHALSVTHLPLLDSLLIHSRGSEILAGIMGCEMSEKDPHCLTVPVCVIWKARLVGTESRAVISRGWGGWEEGRGQLKGIKPAVRRWKVLGSNAWYPAYSQAY